MLVIFIKLIALRLEFIGIFLRVTFGVMCISSSPSSGTYFLLEFLIDGLSKGKYAVYRPSVMTFTYRLAAYSYVPLKYPWHRKIHHWWTLFTIFYSLQNTLTSSSTSLLYLFQYAYYTIFTGCRYQIPTEQTVPTPFCSCKFSEESWTYRYFFLVVPAFP